MIQSIVAAVIVGLGAGEVSPPACLAPNAMVVLPHDVAPQQSGSVCLQHKTRIYRVPTWIVDDTVVDSDGKTHARSTTVAGLSALEDGDAATKVGRTRDGRKLHFNGDASYRQAEKGKESLIFVPPGSPLPKLVEGLKPIYIVP